VATIPTAHVGGFGPVCRILINEAVEKRELPLAVHLCMNTVVVNVKKSGIKKKHHKIWGMQTRTICKMRRLRHTLSA
jgi:hypothetical protein